MLNEVDFAEFQKENFSLLIDARSPREFLHSHLIGALNFYALNDEEYQEIGTIYKKIKLWLRLGVRVIFVKICQSIS